MEKVLILDSDAATRKKIAAGLRQAGFSTRSVAGVIAPRGGH